MTQQSRICIGAYMLVRSSAVIGAVDLSESTQPASALDQAHAEIGGLMRAAVART
jgi:hypothetical protein